MKRFEITIKLKLAVSGKSREDAENDLIKFIKNAALLHSAENDRIKHKNIVIQSSSKIIETKELPF